MLILYNFWLRFSALFNPRKQLGRFFGLVFGVIFAIFYGLLFGYLYSSDDWEEVDFSSRENFLIGLALFFIFMTILRGFYPTYHQLNTWVRPFFPLSGFKRYNLKLSSDFASAFFIPALAFTISMGLMAGDQLGLPFIVKYLVIILGANIVRRMVQAVLEYQFNNRPLLIGGVIAGLLAVIFLQITYPVYASSPVWADLLTIVLVYGCGLIVEEYLPVERKQTAQTEKKNRSIITSLLFQNKKIRSSLLVGFIFKLGFLGADSYVRITSGEHLFESDFLVWLFASPVLIFNYVYNNLWGYHRSLWLTLDRSPNATHSLQKYYLRLLWPPLAADFVISTVYFVLYPEWTVIGIISWVSIAVISIVFGFYWSIYKPRLILKTITTKGNTFFWSNMLSILFTMLLYGMLYTKWLYWLIPVYFIVSGVVFYYAKKEYPELRKALFNELFKE